MNPRTPGVEIARFDATRTPIQAAHEASDHIQMSPQQRQKSTLQDTSSAWSPAGNCAVTKLNARERCASTGTGIRDADPRVLEHWIRSPTTPQRVVRRSQIILLALRGLPTREVASQCGVSPETVRLWTMRVERHGLMTIQHDAPGRGRRSSVDLGTFLERLREANLLDDGGQPVSLRRAGLFLGVSASAVWRALKKTSTAPDRAAAPSSC